jgi:hypothetical protein
MKRIRCLLLVAAVAAADSWIAFGEREWKSPDGGHRLVAREDGSFAFFAGERPLAKGKLVQLPLEVHVLSDGSGAVLFEKYGEVGRGATLAFLAADGALRFKLKLEEAIPGGSAGAQRSVSSIWWSRGWWVDEPRGKAVLVARNGVVSEVDLATGRNEKPPKAAVFHGFELAWARDLALEVAVELKPEGLLAAAALLVADPDLSATTRLRAAVAVERAKGPPVPFEIWDAALEDSVPEADRKSAIAFAGRYVADLALLEEAALRKDVAREAVTALGERGAVKSLAGLLTHGSLDREMRAHVAQTLGRLSAEGVLEAIDKEMEDAEPEQAGALLSAAIATGAPDLAARLQHHESVLLRVLDKQAGDLTWLADYFKGRPTSEAVKPLLKALAIHRADAALRPKLTGALKACSGEDHGDNVDAWIKALGRR